ncbi:MAG: MATE family efflux transporter [Clostridia bacterium]|nr:MATE family efflux transporter [Clostridia bacterium]
MTRDMTRGTPLRLILNFMLPLLAGMIFQQLYNLVDTMIVGQTLGISALAGVGATGSINFLVLGFCMGICSGFSIPVARSFGARDERRLHEYVVNGVILCAGFGLAVTVLTVLLCRTILVLMGTPADCLEPAYEYIVVIFAGIPAMLLYNLLSGYLQALGDSRTPLFFLIFSSVLNVILDLFFILTLHFGIFGAALATVLSQGISGLLCLEWIRRRFPVLHITRDEWKVMGNRMQELCSYGIPMGLQYSITAIGSVILQVGVNSLGSASVAAVTAAGKIHNFLACLPNGLGGTMATYCAQNVGANQYDRLNRGTVTASIIGTVYTVLAVAICMIFGTPLARLFITGTGSEAILVLSQQYMLMNTLFYPLLTLVNVFRFSIQGMGFSMFAIFSGVMEMIARIIAGMILVPMMGFTGCTLANPLAWIFADIFLIPAYLHCKKVLLTKAHHQLPADTPSVETVHEMPECTSGNSVFNRKKACHSC